MRLERRGGPHQHIVSVAATPEGPMRHAKHAVMPAGAGVSLLRLSAPMRLIIVAGAAALLWSAVLWALQ